MDYKEWEECEEIEAQVGYSWQNALQKLKKEGAIIVPISIPALEQSLACYYILASSECSSNMAKYDGLRYGIYFLQKD